MKRVTAFALFFICTMCLANGSGVDVEITDGNSLQSALAAVDRGTHGEQLSGLDEARGFYALGYLRAWLGSSKIWSTLDSPNMVSLPNHIPIGQVAQVVQKYLREHPESLHETADGLVFTALAASFPPSGQVNAK